MRRLALALFVLGAGCRHAQSTGPVAGPAADQGSADTTKAPAGSAPAPDKPTQPDAKSPPIAASPQGILRRGAVHELQRALAAKGFDGRENGLLDDATSKRLAAYQKSQKLPDTGLPDRETLKKLGLDPDEVYRRNDRTDDSH